MNNRHHHLAFLLVCAALSLQVASAQALEPVPTASGSTQPVEVVVQGTRPSRDALELQLNTSDARRVAGTQGDPVKVLESLPGVAHTPIGTGPVVLWGAAPGESRFLVDGVEIPRLFHGGGLRSTVNGDLISDVTLTPGAFGASQGRAIGGIVAQHTRPLPFEGTHTYLDVSTLDGSARVSSTAGEKVRWAIAGRYGWFDRVLTATEADTVRELYTVPRYHDAQAKIEVDLRPQEGIDLVLLESRDDATYAIPEANAAGARSSTTQLGFRRAYLRYHRDLPDGARVEVVPWLGRDRDALSQNFGTTPAHLDTTDWRWGLRARHQSRLSAHLQLEVGADTAASHARVFRAGSLTIPPREGDAAVFGQPPGDEVNSNQWSSDIVNVAPYVQGTITWGALSITPGLRIDNYLIAASRKTPRVGQTPSIGHSALDVVVEPRAQVNLHLSQRVEFMAAAGRYSQAPQATDLSAVFGSPSLGTESASHVTAGEAVEITHSLTVSVMGFYRRASHLATRDASPNPRLAQALVDTGKARSYGVQVLVRQKPWHGFYGWVTSTVSRSERLDDDAIHWRLFDYDEPLLLTLVAGKRLGPWSIGLRWRYARGLPRTPVTGVLYDETSNEYQPILGPKNSIRLPDFWQLDLRCEYMIALGESERLTLYGEMLNATGHANAEEYVYNNRYSQRAVISGLPLVGVIGARLDL